MVALRTLAIRVSGVAKKYCQVLFADAAEGNVYVEKNNNFRNLFLICLIIQGIIGVDCA